jgi:hypothetical protein
MSKVDEEDFMVLRTGLTFGAESTIIFWEISVVRIGY